MKKLQSFFLASLLVLGLGALSACTQSDVGESQVREEGAFEEGYNEPTGNATEEGLFEGNQIEEEGVVEEEESL